MATLALDLATKTGWALAPDCGRIISGTWDFSWRRFEGGGMRFVNFNNLFRQIVEGQNVRQVYFEEVRRHLGTDAAHIYGGLLAHLSAFCETQSLPYSGVPVGTIKKWATGRGNANKAAMIEAMRRRGFAPSDDNEADALACLLCSLDKAKADLLISLQNPPSPREAA
jgi:Holliday junction resolvasome RuvABC endonuclease subunit